MVQQEGVTRSELCVLFKVLLHPGLAEFEAVLNALRAVGLI